MRTILVVDDKEMMRDSVASTLQRAGMSVVTAPDAPAALDLIARKRPDCVVSDFKMPGMTGLELVEKVQQIDQELPVIIMTAFGSIESAVRVIKAGAFDYLTKPFEGDELIITIKRACEAARLARENAILRAESGERGQGPAQSPRGVERLVGSSDAMTRLKEQVASIAASHGTVLITGESGVGKEVVARAIHESSPRAGAPFLGVNCAALSESLLESELFGHERGAFTGAEKLRKGRFELADGGTLLLDEVSEISPRVQAKLLRVLQERAFERVGSSVTIGSDVRVIATSNRDLPRSVAMGEFRQDLYYRLNVLPVSIPSLRERATDVPALASHFVLLICKREGRPVLSFEGPALDALSAYRWPGNVRELQNICERAVVLTSPKATSIPLAMIAPWLRETPTTAVAAAGPLVEPKTGTFATTPDIDGRTLEEIERDAILRALGRFDGHRQKTAAALGIGVRTLGLKIKKWKELNLVPPTL
jgi:DNA-binding NtrC family response regulator